MTLLLEADKLSRLLDRLPGLDPAMQAQLWAGLKPEILARCAQDGLFWLKFVKTRDEADPVNTVKPFPVQLEYVRELWAILDANRRVVIAKSRQMLVSWLVCAYVTHRARFHAHQGIYWQTKAWPDAVKMVCMPSGGVMGRCQFIEEHLPEWMREEYKPSEGRMQYPNGSLIQSLSGGADQTRGITATIYVGDEFGHQDDQDGVYTSVAPLIQKGAKGIFVSTPNGSSNMFATLWHGRPVGEELAG